MPRFRGSLRRAGIVVAFLFPAGLLRADLYVANFNGPSITVYATSAAGNAAPLRTIAGTNTGIAGPSAVTVDSVNSEFYVADFVSQSVRVFALAASGNVVPLRTISGPNSGVVQPRMVAVAPGLFADRERQRRPDPDDQRLCDRSLLPGPRPR